MATLQEQLAALAQEQSEDTELSTLERVAKLVDAADADAEDSLKGLGVDSLGLIALVVRIEQEFGVRVGAQRACQWDTLGSVARDVEKLRKDKA
ncbi:acyl carrier protein [Corynebacterium pelargi]|uniref:acyl carrier protein n=1 Tax=Corynebacterium pelargi TaxID=1471400 RepID=UPI0013E8C7EF|nr:acyl carrier protein [Corynebacterium pelargi]GGG71383.1 hypothetical protein GCM10007338_05470 [Corynebacterium pelargi]